MKKTGQCPKCGSKQVVLILGQSFGTKVYPRATEANYSTVEKYACTDCGYLETYLADQDEIAELRKLISE